VIPQGDDGRPGSGKISSFCEDGGCVKVSKDPLTDLITVSDEDGSEASFFFHEWDAFIKGVKAGEFDLDKLAEPTGTREG